MDRHLELTSIPLKFIIVSCLCHVFEEIIKDHRYCPTDVVRIYSLVHAESNLNIVIFLVRFVFFFIVLYSILCMHGAQISLLNVFTDDKKEVLTENWITKP